MTSTVRLLRLIENSGPVIQALEYQLQCSSIATFQFLIGLYKMPNLCAGVDDLSSYDARSARSLLPNWVMLADRIVTPLGSRGLDSDY